MTTEFFITDVNTLKPEMIKWTINPSNVKAANGTQFTVYRVVPNVTSATGRDSPLIIETDKVFSFGVSERDKLSGAEGKDYSVPLSMYDINGATPHQEKFVAACDMISAAGRTFLIENKASVGKNKWIESDVREVEIIWYGKDGKAGNKRPTLYAKLPTNKKGEITCDFIQPFKKNGVVYNRKVDPLTYRDVRCNVRAAVRIECIFVSGSVQAFQCKLYELMVFPMPKKTSVLAIREADMDDLEEEEEGSESGVEQEEEKETEDTEAPTMDILAPVEPPPATAPAAVDETKPKRGRKKL